MANDLLIRKRIEVIKKEMNQLLANIAKEYEESKIKSPIELQHKVFSTLQLFYESIGKETFVPIHAWGPPYSKDHNIMMNQLYRDINTMYLEINNLTKDLSDNFEQVELERQSFDSRLQKLQDIIKDVDLHMRKSDYKVIFRDYFVDHEHYDKDMATLPPAHLSANEGLLTLTRLDAEQYNEYATITLLDGNGFPGNTHVVRSVENTLKFDGQEEMHINLADILDGNADTWFEYEIFEPTEKAMEITEGKGFEYDEAIRWITHNKDPLKAVIKIEFNKAKTMNWISLSPFIPSDKGSTAAIIEQVVVSDEKGNIYSMGENELFNTEKGYLFPRQSCKTITLFLKQESGYETDIGHVFFKQINKTEITVMDKETERDGIRIYGKAPSIRNLGVIYDTGKEEIIYPTMSYGDKIKDEAIKKQELFDLPITPLNVHVGLEKIPAWRYIIGIRDISLANYQFEKESEYVSTPFISSTPIKEIELEVNVDIPDNFPKDTDWIEYYISTNDGQNWNQIYPRNIYKSSAKTKYLFNSGVPKEGRIEEVGYIESLTDIYQVQLKMVLKRPEDIKDAKFYTPIVYNYELHTVVAEEMV